MGEATKNQRKEFKVGDKVRSPKFGVGVVEGVDVSETTYPILVKWTDGSNNEEVYTYYTAEGQYYSNRGNAYMDIELLEEEPEEEKEMANEESKFKVGDHVWSFHFGVGIVHTVYGATNTPYPVVVKWTDAARSPNTYDYFTKDGKFDYEGDITKDIIPFEVIGSSEEDDVVDRMMDALAKKDDAINPSHYRVKGIPEAIHLMMQLMTKEQLEGFCWGNVLKYAYRYGRKGDKKETAGKIEWYAKKLKELKECESK